MAFDPDKYLAKNSQGFDPDKYLALTEYLAPIEDEASPEVSAQDRFVAKNFAQSPQKQAEFLKQKYPGLDVKVVGSDVAIRKKGEKGYKKLDPSSFEFADLTDVADTFGAGVASSLGTAAGAFGGALIGGAGAIPGAMAGAAGAGAGYEALRQKLGQKLGIPQEVSGTDAAIAGGANALGVGVFGTGPAMKEAVKQLALRQGITEEAAKKILESQGALRYAWNEGAPSMASAWFGPSKEEVKFMANPETRQVAQRLIGNKTQKAEEILGDIKLGYYDQLGKVGKELEETITGAEGKVNIQDIRNAYMRYIGQLQENYDKLPNAESKAALDAAKATFENLFKNQKVNDTVFKEVTDGGKLMSVTSKEVPLRIPNERPPADPLKVAARNPYDMMGFRTPEEVAKEAAELEAQARAKDPNLLMKLMEVTRSPLKNETRQMSRLEAFPGTPQEIPMNLSPTAAWQFQKQLKDYGDIRGLSNTIQPRFPNASSDSMKALSNEGLNAYRGLNQKLDQVTEGASSELKGKYADLVKVRERILPGFNSEQKALDTLRNIDTSKKAITSEALDRLGQMTGRDYKKDVIALKAAEYWDSKSLTPVSMGGATSTTRTLPAALVGGLIGGKLGYSVGGPSGAAAGAAAGTIGGNMMASPAAFRTLIQATDPLRRGANALGQYAVPYTPLYREAITQGYPSAWEYMMNPPNQRPTSP